MTVGTETAGGEVSGAVQLEMASEWRRRRRGREVRRGVDRPGGTVSWVRRAATNLIKEVLAVRSLVSY